MNPYRRVILLKYEVVGLIALSTGKWPVRLTCRVQTWWGMCETTRSFIIHVDSGVDLDKFYEDKLNKWI